MVTPRRSLLAPRLTHTVQVWAGGLSPTQWHTLLQAKGALSSDPMLLGFAQSHLLPGPLRPPHIKPQPSPRVPKGPLRPPHFICDILGYTPVKWPFCAHALCPL